MKQAGERVSECVSESRSLMAPKASRRVLAISRAKVPQCLVWLGVPRKEAYWRWRTDRRVRPYGASFWDRKHAELMDLFDKGQRAFRKAMKAAHPDKGGCVKRASELNLVWNRVKYLYKQQGLLLLAYSLTHSLTYSQSLQIPATNTLTLTQAVAYSEIADKSYVTVKRASYAVTNVWRQFQVAPGLTNWRIVDTSQPVWLWTNTHVVGMVPTLPPPPLPR